jgi:hypothetical protein
LLQSLTHFGAEAELEKEFAMHEEAWLTCSAQANPESKCSLRSHGKLETAVILVQSEHESCSFTCFTVSS